MRKKAFTLIELLVVVSIIALLVSILMPALGKARIAAQKVVCSTNLRTFGQVMVMYAGDYDDRISSPTVGIDGVHIDHQCRDWHLRFLPYTEAPTIYECPAFTPNKLNEDGPLPLTEFVAPSGKYEGQTFRLNYTGAVYAFAGYDYDRRDGNYYDPSRGGRAWKLTEIQRFAARDDWRGLILGDGIYRINNDEWIPRNKLIEVGYATVGGNAGRGFYLHGNAANFLVADGRVGWQDADWVWENCYNGTETSFDRYPPEAYGLRPSMLK